MKSNEINQQIHNNLVAILTLLIAIMALGFSAWRAERSEKNNTVRTAAFEVLKNLGELQVVVNYSYYSPGNTKSDPMLGWGYVSLISDLSQTLPPPIPKTVEQLIDAWNSNWKQLNTSEQSATDISSQIDNSRSAILEELRKLD